eukprot:TRINITY_DN20514_c0_g1_i1.p1 TRINITY_DN20514_c0_g1~~TRINITY_DN20514_c0_g1_i1.p1  ORF type:complete len:284 (+),score=21.26 TRINITY_DN20514_c0_g1_i1:68-853(+)
MAPQRQATVTETCGITEWCIVALPLVYWVLRIQYGLEGFNPLMWTSALFLLVLLIAVKEHYQGVGSELMKETTTTTKTQTKKSTFSKIKHFTTSRTCGTDRHTPVKTAIKGASCALFLIPAADIIYLHTVYPEHGRMFPRYEAVMLLCQAIFAFMADHVMVPRDSYWHPIDRVSALTLTLYGFTKFLHIPMPYYCALTAALGVFSCCVYFACVARRHHGLPTHHVHHAIFHVVVATGWNWSNLSTIYYASEEAVVWLGDGL